MNTPYPKEYLGLHTDLNKNEECLRDIFENADDIVFRHFRIDGSSQEALLVFLSNFIRKDLMDGRLLQELINAGLHQARPTQDSIRNHLVSASEVHEIDTFQGICDNILYGNSVLLIHGQTTAIGIEATEWEHRTVSKSDNEVSLHGPQQAFTEVMMNNVALIRRFIFNIHFKVKRGTLGEFTKTPYCLVYIDGVVDPAVLQEVKKRLIRSPVDKILDTGNIEDLIRDNLWSPFPTVNYTEKPDKVAAQLLEGRVGILLENSPMALTVPALFTEFLQASEDYYGHFLLQSVIRILRYLALWVCLVLPSFYVAISTYHHELIPSSLIVSLIQQRQGVPLPTAIEVLVMESIFEVLREAGLRLPRPIGQAVSIVGALVIGQAAVMASIVMASTVIVVATTAICSFTIPALTASSAFRMLRFPLLIITGIFGLLGLVLGILIILFHLTTLKSFGVNYTSSLSPGNLKDIQDTIIRAPAQVKIDSSVVGRRRRKYLSSKSRSGQGEH